VWFHGPAERLQTLPIEWTDLELPNPFVRMSRGRSRLRPEDLLALANLLDEIQRGRPPRPRKTGKRILSDMSR
jgi:hypothetical protein